MSGVGKSCFQTEIYVVARCGIYFCHAGNCNVETRDGFIELEVGILVVAIWEMRPE